MDENAKFIENMIKENSDIVFSKTIIEKSNACFYKLNGHQDITVLPKRDLYSLTFLYNVDNLVKHNNFDDFFQEIFPTVAFASDVIVDGLKMVHKVIVENIERLVYFTDIPLKIDSCKGNITIIFDIKNKCFHSIVMTGLLACVFERYSCFYNIKYNYGNLEDFCLMLSRNTLSKSISKFSNNVFLHLIDNKMNDILPDIYTDYTKEDIKNFKTLYNMVSI